MRCFLSLSGVLVGLLHPGKESQVNIKKAPRPGYREVFCRYITRNGKIIYPKNASVFHFYVKA